MPYFSKKIDETELISTTDYILVHYDAEMVDFSVNDVLMYLLRLFQLMQNDSEEKDKNHIKRLISDEFFFYRYSPFSVDELQTLISEMELIFVGYENEIHFCLGTFNVIDSKERLHNVCLYVECGFDSVRVSVVSKKITASGDPFQEVYETLDLSSPEYRDNPSEIGISSEEMVETFQRNVLVDMSINKSRVLSTVEICLDSSKNYALRSLENFFENFSPSDRPVLQISPILVSSTIDRNFFMEEKIGRVTQADCMLPPLRNEADMLSDYERECMHAFFNVEVLARGVLHATPFRKQTDVLIKKKKEFMPLISDFFLDKQCNKLSKEDATHLREKHEKFKKTLSENFKEKLTDIMAAIYEMSRLAFDNNIWGSVFEDDQGLLRLSIKNELMAFMVSSGFVFPQRIEDGAEGMVSLVVTEYFLRELHAFLNVLKFGSPEAINFQGKQLLILYKYQYGEKTEDFLLSSTFRNNNIQQRL